MFVSNTENAAVAAAHSYFAMKKADSV